jgi:hypothetical protein
MPELKRLHADAIPAALEKAEKYRLLNHPWEADSICRDVLAADPENQPAITLLLLSLTDQFDRDPGGRFRAARDLLPRITDPYRRAYYTGIVHERHANSVLRREAPGTWEAVYEELREAMRCYEEAEGQRPAGNPEAILRWNACARLIERHDQLAPGAEDRFVPLLE